MAKAIGTALPPVVSNCNALARSTPDGDWLPIATWKRDDGMHFYDPTGLKIVPPSEWRWCELDEIDRVMAEQGTTLLVGFMQ